MDTQDLSRASRPRPTLRVRASTEADGGAIAAIYRHHVLHGTASFETEPPGEEEMRRRRADILARGLPYLVAEDGDGTVLGYAYASAYRPRAAYRNTVENSVYVRHDIVGCGVGRLLLSELIARCAALGLRQMVAVVGDSANVASVRLHKAFGFRLIGTLSAVGRKHGRWLDTVLLQRQLGEGNRTDPAEGG
jgi:phosphinothricin acetyltransferase